ncbi:VOC family protein [Streptomyces sp. NPDC015139]|uniref:VOC family protein n=1 Tax=Streptomyces sp. NPDC015139 TaxID=3364942 RepID=UPI0037021D00
MPRRTAYTEGTPCWIGYAGVDPTGAKDFYAPLFGWEFRSEGGRGHHLILPGGGGGGDGDGLVRGDGRDGGDGGEDIGGDRDGTGVQGDGDGTGSGTDDARAGIVGGLGPSPAGPRFGSSWTVYLAAKDLGAAHRRAEERGARVLVRGVPAGADGRLSLAVDPLGASFGLWHGAHDEGVVLVDEPGALTAAVLRTPHPDASATFYREVCGTEAATDEAERAGWVPYFGVVDVAAFEDRARAAGARLLAPGLLRDPWGAVFGVTARYGAARAA